MTPYVGVARLIEVSVMAVCDVIGIPVYTYFNRNTILVQT